VTGRTSAESGFTLIEVLIGLTLLAMLATLIANGTRLSGRAWNTAERRTAESDDMGAVQGLLRRTIERARPSFVAADPADMTVAFSGAPDTLSLVAAQPGTQGSGPWVRQRFYVARSGRTRALFTSWQADAGTDGQSAPAGEAMVLDHVAALRFAYFGPPRTGEAPVWLEHWTARDRLPALVRVTIERDGAGFAAWPELVVATRITANASCIYDALRPTCQRVR
jgi:general secretion pathway protein J